MTQAIDFADTESQEHEEQAGAEAATGRSAGAMLRQAREAKGIHVELLSATLKVPSKRIEALENDQLDDMPDLAFARALSASICRHLQIAPEPVLALLPESSVRSSTAMAQTEARRQALNMPIPARAAGGSKPVLKLLWVVLLVLALAGLLWFGLKAKPEQLDSSAAAPLITPTDELAPEMDGMALPQEGMASADGDAELVPTAQATLPAGVQVLTVADDKYVVEQLVSGDAPVVTLIPVISSVKLQIAAQAESWVQVKDADKKQLINRALKAGESLELEGKPPYFVNIGRLEAVQVRQNGQPVPALDGKKGVYRAELPLP